MKSMEKLKVLREAGAEQKLAEAIVKTQEESDYVSKEYLDGKLAELLLKLVLATVAVGGIILGALYFATSQVLNAIARGA